MEALETSEACKRLCKFEKKWGMYFSFNTDCLNSYEEIYKAAPWLGNESVDVQILVDQEGLLLFDSKEEMESIYYQTIGDDGPRLDYINKYNGPARVYAITINPDGNWINENT